MLAHNLIGYLLDNPEQPNDFPRAFNALLDRLPAPFPIGQYGALPCVCMNCGHDFDHVGMLFITCPDCHGTATDKRATRLYWLIADCLRHKYESFEVNMLIAQVVYSRTHSLTSK